MRCAPHVPLPAAYNSWVLQARCLPRSRRPTPSRLPAHMSPLFPRFPFDSAVRDGVQPAAELRHVQRHKHAGDVFGALRACPASSLHSWALPARAACAAAAPTPCHLPACMSPLFLCFPSDSAGRGGVQPAAELRHVQRHNYAKHVFGALRARPCQKPPQLGPASTLLALVPPPHALPPPGPHCRPSS